MFTWQANWLKITVIVVASLAFDLGLHFLWAPVPDYVHPVSALVERGGFLPVVSLLLLATYAALAVIFQRIQAKLPGTRLAKGLRYGIAFGGLMFVSAPAMSLLFGSSLMAELRGGLVDGVALCLLGVMLGQFTATDGSAQPPQAFARAIASIGVVASIYLLLHVIVYLALPSLFPPYLTQHAASTWWLLVVGLWIGVMNWLLRTAFSTGPLLRQAIAFAVVAFGVFWLLNTLFVPVFVAAPTGTLLLNTGVGILIVGVAVWVERLVRPQDLQAQRTRGAA